MREVAKRTGMSPATVHRLFRERGLRPHRTETFKFSTDPALEAKIRDVVGLYLDPPDGAVVLSVDEKTQIQALDRTQPMLPMHPVEQHLASGHGGSAPSRSPAACGHRLRPVGCHRLHFPRVQRPSPSRRKATAREQASRGKPTGGRTLRVLVTGGAGFIGHHLVRALLERGDEVVVIDDFSTGSRGRLQAVANEIQLVEGSILDEHALDRAVTGCDLILHEAALASVERSFESPVLTNAVNVDGTIRVVLAAARRGVRRIVLAGSSSVYGVPEELPCRESMKPSPESPYGVSKLAAEYYLHTIGRHLGVETVSLRYFNVFGPGQDPTSDYAAVIPLFIKAVLRGRRPTINGDGDISRDFTYVDNVVSANLLAATVQDVAGLTANVACGERTTLLELLAAICDAAGRNVEPIFGAPRSGDIEHSQSDISLASAQLGYHVSVPFADGIRRTVDWYSAAGLPQR